LAEYPYEAGFDPPSILFTIIHFILHSSIMREGWDGPDEFRVRDKKQAVEAKQASTDPATAFTIIDGFNLAHGAVEANTLAGHDAAGLSFGAIPMLSDMRHIIYNTRRLEG
jgi:hypothetical protein